MTDSSPRRGLKTSPKSPKPDGSEGFLKTPTRRIGEVLTKPRRREVGLKASFDLLLVVEDL